MYWRPRVSERSLRRTGRLWTLSTTAHTVPFIAAGTVLAVLRPITLPITFVLLAHAWIIPELYAARGAGVVRQAGRGAGAVRDAARGAGVVRAGARCSGDAERVALGLLGDLLDHRARELHARTGMVVERGELGVWLLAEAGAVLVRPSGRRVHCYCVKVPDRELPPSDRVAHLLLALRTDESGFATVANLAFSGARWRLRRRLPARAREALDLAAKESRGL